MYCIPVYNTVYVHTLLRNWVVIEEPPRGAYYAIKKEFFS